MRAMCADDLREVAALERACFAHAWSEQGLRDALLNAHTVFFVARDGEKLLGYAGMHVILDEGYVDNIAVFPDARRAGVASSLLRALLDDCAARPLSFLTLEVRAGNIPAIKLYEKFQFENAGIRRGFYDDPKEDALLMTRYFQGN